MFQPTKYLYLFMLFPVLLKQKDPAGMVGFVFKLEPIALVRKGNLFGITLREVAQAQFKVELR